MMDYIANYGGDDLERLFLHDRLFVPNIYFLDECNNKIISIKKTNIPDVDMKDLIARHKARYGLVALFCRPGLKVLDFPCGSGYASKLLNEYGVNYIGADFDWVTIEYAKNVYGQYGRFIQDNFIDLKVLDTTFDIIACIEGIEHIEEKNQIKVIENFYNLLNAGGRLIISCPEAKRASGASETNKYHLYELTRVDFEELLYKFFYDVQILDQENKLSTGEMQNCLYGVCRK